MFLETADPTLQVESTISPENALKIVEEKPYDCVVSDYKMPGMNGIELAQQIRETSNIPFIIYTGRGSEEVAEAAFSAGVDDYLRKELEPSHYQVLVKRVRAAVEKFRADRSLRESEERFRGIAERSFDVIFTVDLEGHFTYLSPSAERIMGDKAEELIGKHFQEFIPDSGIPIAVQAFTEVLKGRIAKGSHTEICGKDGSIVVAEINASPTIKDGEIVGIQGIFRDITERKKAEEAIKESEERYRLLFENAGAAITYFDTEGICLLVNKQGIKYHEGKDITGKSIYEIHPEVADFHMQRFKKIMNEGKGGEFEDAFELPSGKRWFSSNIQPVKDKEGNLVGVQLISFDITKRKKAEEEIMNLARFPSENPNPVLRIAEDGVILYANDAANSLLSEWESEVGQAAPDHWRRIISEVLQSGSGKDIEIAHGDRMISFMFAPVMYAGYVNIYGRDITERKKTEEDRERLFKAIEMAKEAVNIQSPDLITIYASRARARAKLKQAEEKLLEYADHLEELAEERSRELLNAERMAAAGRVAAMVGHDLRGPLQTIMNATYLLRQSPEKAEDSLKMIEGAVHRATQMLEEFRNRTRDTPPHIVTVDLESLVRVAVEEAQIPGSIDVALRLGEGLEAVSLDPMKMRRVFDNLIGNAVDAMPEGGTLALSARAKDDRVVIEVSDTGVGIPEEEMGNLFKPFHTTKPSGMGLGLAYCKRAVEAHGGTITAETKVGEGTTFTVKIPVKLK